MNDLTASQSIPIKKEVKVMATSRFIDMSSLGNEMAVAFYKYWMEY